VTATGTVTGMAAVTATGIVIAMAERIVTVTDGEITTVIVATGSATGVVTIIVTLRDIRIRDSIHTMAAADIEAVTLAGSTPIRSPNSRAIATGSNAGETTLATADRMIFTDRVVTETLIADTALSMVTKTLTEMPIATDSVEDTIRLTDSMLAIVAGKRNLRREMAGKPEVERYSFDFRLFTFDLFSVCG